MKAAHDLVMQAKQRIQEVSLADAPQAIAQADVLIDVREGAEFEAGHLPNAVCIPRGLLEFKLDGDPSLKNRSTRIVLYCKSSGRAALCAASLADMGYSHVLSIAGGYDAWVAAGLAVQQPDQTAFD
jgi:rhodanese-related sulfurtransferase